MYIQVCMAPLAPPRRIEVTVEVSAGAARPAEPRPAPPPPPAPDGNKPFLSLR